jgi:predicted TIM-barrel fold metal-dependent hydrolase
MHIFDEPKIDCHAHVFDPANFPYGENIAYKPSGQEIGRTAQLHEVMNAYGVRHALLVHVATLKKLRAQGIVGAAVNPTFHGNDHYLHAESLMKRLADLDMVLNLQVENDQLLMFAPWIERIPVRVVIDHLARPTISAGLGQPAFAALLRLARIGRVSVKISGYSKYSKMPYPFQDCWPFVRAVVDAFTLDHCLWASDWPFLRATARQDYGPLVALAGRLFPNAADRRKLFWDTPYRLFNFAQ